jgi:hypothetical protein
MKDFGKDKAQQPQNKDKTVNAPLGGARHDTNRPMGGGGINQKTPPSGANTGRGDLGQKDKDRGGKL